MGYELIDIEDLSPLPNRSATGLEISDHYVPTGETPPETKTRGPENVGLRVYLVDPGESLGEGMHYHDEQEEIFYVVDGVLHVETPDDVYRVASGQALVVEPESPQRAFNPAEADDSVTVVAIGAPSYRVIGRNDAHSYDPDEAETDR
jgi:mannose-6-phosphate isomerase-like protein (cupin superfamily)